MAYGDMYRTNRTGWGLGSRYGSSYRTGNLFGSRIARGGIGRGRELEGYRGTRGIGYGGEFDRYRGTTRRTGFESDLGYGSEYLGGGAAYYKSDYETDFGDPFGDRQRGTPIRMMRGEWNESFGYGRDFEPGYGRTYRGTTRGYGLNYGRDFSAGRGGTYWGRRPTGWRY